MVSLAASVEINIDVDWDVKPQTNQTNYTPPQFYLTWKIPVIIMNSHSVDPDPNAKMLIGLRKGKGCEKLQHLVYSFSPQTPAIIKEKSHYENIHQVSHLIVATGCHRHKIGTVRLLGKTQVHLEVGKKSIKNPTS